MKESLLHFRELVAKEELRSLYFAAEVLEAVHFAGGLEKNKRRIANAETNWYRGFEDSPKSTLRSRLEKFTTKRARLVGYEAWMLLGRPDAAEAYRALVESVYFLGRTAFEIDDISGFDFDVPHSIDAHIHACALQLARLTRCDCWTAYLWRGEEALPALVNAQGLWYPEALMGFSHLPADLAKQQAMGNQCKSLQHSSEARFDDQEGFRKRECIAASLPVALAVGPDTALICVNWRRKDAVGPQAVGERLGAQVPAMMAGVATRVLNDMEAWSSKHATGETPAIRSESLGPTIKYMSGWLSERARQVPTASRHLPVDAVRAREVQHSVFQALADHLDDRPTSGTSDRSGIGDQLARNIKHIILQHVLGGAFKADQYEVDILHVLDGMLQLPNGPLYDWRGEKVADGGAVRTQGYDRDLLPEGSSLSAQAIAWATSLLLARVPAAEGRNDPHEHSLIRRAVSSREWAYARSELAVPVFRGRTPVAAVSVEVERPGALSAGHLLWIETIAVLVGTVLEVLAHENESDSERQLLFGTFNNHPAPPASEEELWSIYTRWAMEQTKADLVHVVARGGGTGMCDRFGVIGSSRFVAGLLNDVRAQHSWSYIRQLLKANEVDERMAGVREVLRAEEAGVSRSLLMGVQQSYQWKPGGRSQKRRVLTEPLRGGAVGMAISPNPLVMPCAALWIGWCDETSRLEPSNLARVSRFASVFAALHLAYQVERRSAEHEQTRM